MNVHIHFVILHNDRSTNNVNLTSQENWKDFVNLVCYVVLRVIMSTIYQAVDGLNYSLEMCNFHLLRKRLKGAKWKCNNRNMIFKIDSAFSISQQFPFLNSYFN